MRCILAPVWLATLAMSLPAFGDVVDAPPAGSGAPPAPYGPAPAYAPGYGPPPAPSPYPAPAPTRAPDDELEQRPGSVLFIDAVSATVFLDDRFEATPFTAGLQLGGMIGGRVRLAARALFWGHDVGDIGNPGQDSARVDSDPPRLLGAATAGVRLGSGASFYAAPGLTVGRTDVGEYGTFAGLALPFEWTTRDRVHVSFELDVGRAIGGIVRGACLGFTPTCEIGVTEEIDREASAALVLSAAVGWASGP